MDQEYVKKNIAMDKCVVPLSANTALIATSLPSL